MEYIWYALPSTYLLMLSHSLLHLPLAHHSHPPSHIHSFIPGSKLTFSTIVCYGLPSWTILDWIYIFFLFWVVWYSKLA